MALTDAEKQELLNEMKASSNDVSELETVDSLDGIVSLPAMKGEELVNAPIALLRKPAEEAARVANAAASNAEQKALQAENSSIVATNMANLAKDCATEAKELATETQETITRSVAWEDIDAVREMSDYGMWRVVNTSADAIGILFVYGDGMGHTVNQWLMTVWEIEAGGLPSHLHGDYRLWCRHYLASGTSTEAEVGEWSDWVLYERRVMAEVSSLRTLVKSLIGSDGTALSWKGTVVDLGGVVSDVDVVDGSCVDGVAVYAEDLGQIVYLLNGTYYANMSDKTAWVDESGNAYTTKLYRTKSELWIATGSGSRLERLVISSHYCLWLLGEDADPLSYKAETNRAVLAELSELPTGMKVALTPEDGAGSLLGSWMGDGAVDVLLHGVTRRYTFDADGLSSIEYLPTDTGGVGGGWIEVE